MPKCPNCGGEIGEGDALCKSCGTKLIGFEKQTKTRSSLDEVENTVIGRLDGIKNRDEDVIRALIDEHYNKFDDWPPFARQEVAEALKNEFQAFKVLSNYGYEVKDFEAKILDNAAVATFHLHYQGVIRDRSFDITSRVTSVLRKEDSAWKVVHEHFSRFPEGRQQQAVASSSPQSATSQPSPSNPPSRERIRTHAILGFISAVLSLFILPEIFGSVAIVLGAYMWRTRQGHLGIILVILGILCMITGIEFTAFL
jgi:ketosteroid isomerase-like protein